MSENIVRLWCNFNTEALPVMDKLEKKFGQIFRYPQLREPPKTGEELLRRVVGRTILDVSFDPEVLSIDNFLNHLDDSDGLRQFRGQLVGSYQVLKSDTLETKEI